MFPLIVVLALMAGALIAQDKSVTLTGYRSITCVPPATPTTKPSPPGSRPRHELFNHGGVREERLPVFPGDSFISWMTRATKRGSPAEEHQVEESLHVKAEGTVDGAHSR